jgi:hypothetical protein
MSENTVTITSGFIPYGYVPIGLAAFMVRKGWYKQEWDEEIARGGPETFQGEGSDGSPIEYVLTSTLDDALYDLRQALAHGRLTGYAMSDDGGEPAPIPPGHWAARQAAVLFEEWRDFNTSYSLPTTLGPVDGRALVRVADVERMLVEGRGGGPGASPMGTTGPGTESAEPRSRQMPQPQRSRAKRILQELHPKRPPPTDEFGLKALWAEVTSHPNGQGISKDTVRRAANELRRERK